MHRRLVAFVVAFLLLGMQQEAQLHALTHLRDQLQRSHEQGLQILSADTACAECALLAGGSGVVPADSTATPPPIARFAAPVAAVPSRAVAAPSYYSSRGPPATL